jgi:phosphohistidine phosphatase SixA
MTKTLMLMRHGHYNMPDNDDGKKTHLSETGVSQVQQAAEKVIDSEMVPDAVLSSPIVRALESATIMHKAFEKASGKQIPFLVVDDLAEDKSLRIPALLGSFNEASERPLIVTHQPNIGHLGFQLILNEVAPPASTAEILVFESPAEDWKGVKRAVMTRRLAS